MTNRRKIEHRLLRKGSNANKITKDRIGSGSIEVKHLNFGDIGSGDYLVDLADTDVLALSDASNSNAMRGLKLGDFKKDISHSFSEDLVYLIKKINILKPDIIIISPLPLRLVELARFSLMPEAQVVNLVVT